ncbi:hypothetical protein ACFL15_00915 [Patescibacteria group bacterium]
MTDLKEAEQFDSGNYENLLLKRKGNDFINSYKSNKLNTNTQLAKLNEGKPILGFEKETIDFCLSYTEKEKSGKFKPEELENEKKQFKITIQNNIMLKNAGKDSLKPGFEGGIVASQPTGDKD